MTSHLGNVHNYLELTLDYTEGSNVKASMINLHI